MDFFGNTDIGRKRQTNQDSFFVQRLGENAILLAVFDGMGGHAGGETASRIARETFAQTVSDALQSRVNAASGIIDASKTQIYNILCRGAERSNTAIFEKAKETPQLLGMGTTLAAVLINGDNVYAVNVGDSRIYLVWADKITQLSHDHSYVQFLVDIGEITEEEAKTNKNKNIITRAIGTSESIEVDTFVQPLDTAGVLLCSDGLSNLVDDTEILAVFAESSSAKECVSRLISAANENGGLDNITVVAAGDFSRR